VKKAFRCIALSDAGREASRGLARRREKEEEEEEEEGFKLFPEGI